MLQTPGPQAATKEETMNTPLSAATMMSGQDFRESLRRRLAAFFK
jgi:hypothetical protein